MAALNPSGVPLEPATLERLTSSDVPADDEGWDRSGEAGLIVKRGRVGRAGSDGDGGDHIIDEGDGHGDA
jgi:hypothetical protein